VYYRYKKHEQHCNRSNFMTPNITRQVKQESIGMSLFVSNRLGRSKHWRPSGENFPKVYQLQVMKVDRQLDSIRLLN
jgi:hypothetical protein